MSWTFDSYPQEILHCWLDSPGVQTIKKLEISKNILSFQEYISTTGNWPVQVTVLVEEK